MHGIIVNFYGVENRKQTEQQGQLPDLLQWIALRNENSPDWVDPDKFNETLDMVAASRDDSKGGRPTIRSVDIWDIFRNHANDWTSLTEVADRMFPNHKSRREYASKEIHYFDKAIKEDNFEIETVIIRSSESNETYYRISHLSSGGDK